MSTKGKIFRSETQNAYFVLRKHLPHYVHGWPGVLRINVRPKRRIFVRVHEEGWPLSFQNKRSWTKEEKGPKSQFLVGLLWWMTPNDVNKSMYAYTIKCRSTFFLKLRLTDFSWYRDISWYRDTSTGIVVAMTKSGVGTKICHTLTILG